MSTRHAKRRVEPNEVPAPPTSLVIATQRNPACVLDTIVSVLAGDPAPSEIVIVDQSDRPASALERLADPPSSPIRYAHVPPFGPAYARNVGLALARYSPLVIMDDNALMTADTYGVLVRALLTAGPETVVLGRVTTVPPHARPHRPSTVPADILRTPRAPFDKTLLDRPVTLYRAALTDVGGFDDDAHNALAARLSEAGYQVRVAPAAVAYHRASHPRSGRHAPWLVQRVADLGRQVWQTPAALARHERERIARDVSLVAGHVARVVRA